MKNIFVQMKWVKRQTKAFTLFLLIPILIEGILSLTGVSMAILSKYIIDTAESKQKDLLIRYCVIFITIVLIELVLDAALSLVKIRNTEAITNSMREGFFHRLKEKEWIELSRYHSGDILTRMTSDITSITNVVTNTIPDIVSLGVSLVASFVALLYLQPYLAAVAFILGPISIAVSRVYARKLKKINHQIQSSEGKCRAFLQESMQNINIIKAFCLQNNTDTEIKKLQSRKYKLVMNRGKFTMVSNSALSISYWIGYMVAFGWGVIGVFNGFATFGSLTAFIQLIGKVQGPFTGLAYTIPQLISASASIERLMEMENLEDEIKKDCSLSYGNLGIKFENVGYFYEKNNIILNDVSIQIGSGDITAIVGSSGEGKTTFIRLILSLIRPKTGKVYVTSEEKSFEINASTRKLISYVPQGNTLFSGTIEENLRFGGSEASEQELIKALQLACAWDFVEALENGIKTVIGENGVGLSEGQAQRIAIARALLRDTPIIIFDEATSSLDSNTELKILKEISKISKDKTCIIITHRPSALRICNRVLKLEDGILRENNNYDEVAMTSYNNHVVI